MPSRALADPAAVATRLARIDEPHVKPLNDLVRALRDERGGGPVVPWVDPAGAGTAARVLFLLEAPGAMATANDASGRSRTGSGLISPDNDDRTAAALYAMRDEAGLSPTDCLHWNVVPWYIGSTSKIRNPNVKDLREAIPALSRFLALLPDLCVVVPMGRKAQRAWALFQLEAGGRPSVRVMPSLHPSPLVLNRHPGNRAAIVAVLREAAQFLIAQQR